MLGKYRTISNRTPATTLIYPMRTYFSPWQTSTANVTKPFLRKHPHPLRLNIGTLQNLPSCCHMSRFKSITSIHCQRPLQKHVNNHIDNVNGVTFVTCKHMSPQGSIFLGRGPLDLFVKNWGFKPEFCGSCHKYTLLLVIAS